MCRVELASRVIGGSIIFAIMEYEIVKCCINIKCDVFIKKKRGFAFKYTSSRKYLIPYHRNRFVSTFYVLVDFHYSANEIYFKMFRITHIIYS